MIVGWLISFKPSLRPAYNHKGLILTFVCVPNKYNPFLLKTFIYYTAVVAVTQNY